MAIGGAEHGVRTSDGVRSGASWGHGARRRGRPESYTAEQDRHRCPVLLLFVGRKRRDGMDSLCPITRPLEAVEGIEACLLPR